MAFDDKDLIQRFKSGNVSAFEELLRRYQDRVYNLCRHMVDDRDDARDAAQDVFIKAFRALKSYKPDAGFYTWIYRIAVNTCLDFKKKRQVPPLDVELMDSFPSGGPFPEEVYESKEAGRIIEAALQRLPKKLRAAIVLREMEGLSYEETASVLGISTGTVKSRIARAREQLRGFLQKKI
jgi:RNA polymerase sigma-70 factor, ECF subfamily